MTISTVELIFGVASQVIPFDPDEGRPSAVASVEVWQSYADDTSTAEDATTGSASVATNPNTTLSAGASAGDVTLTVTSGTGFAVGSRYLLTEDSNGLSEWVEALGVNGTTITTRHPLRNTYTSGAAIVTTRFTIAVDDTWAADQHNLIPPGPNPAYRAKAVCTIGGASKVVEVGLDLMRYPSRTGVTGLDVDEIYPGWVDRLPPDYQLDQGRALIRRAEQAVKYDLYGDNRADQSLRNPEHRARLVVVRANLDLIRDNVFRGSATETALALAERDWRQIYDQTIRAPVAAVDTSGGGASAPIRPLPLWVR